MKCIKCGEEIEANARFCKFCGQKTEPEVITAIKKPVEDSTPEEAPTPVFEEDNEATVLLEYDHPVTLEEAPENVDAIEDNVNTEPTDITEVTEKEENIVPTIIPDKVEQTAKPVFPVGKLVALCIAGVMVLAGIIIGAASIFIGQSGSDISGLFPPSASINDSYGFFGDSTVDNYIGDMASDYDFEDYFDEYDYEYDYDDYDYSYSDSTYNDYSGSTVVKSESKSNYESNTAKDYYYYYEAPADTAEEAVAEAPAEDYNDYYYEAEPATEVETAEVKVEAAEVNENNKVVIAYGGLRLRDKPDIDKGKKIGLIPDGTIITVESTRNNWAYTNYNGISGWCSCDFLFPPSTYSGKALYSAMVSIYPGVELVTNNYFDGKNVTTTIPYSATVYVYETSGNSAFVSYNNIYGWCATDYLVH